MIKPALPQKSQEDKAGTKGPSSQGYGSSGSHVWM